MALHALLVTSILWSAGSPPSHPRDAGALDAAAPEAADDGALQVIFIQDTAPTAASVPGSTVGTATLTLLAIPSAEALANVAMSVPDVSVDPASTVATPAPDAALRSALYGRYVGQIDARIERAWRRPRTEIGAPVFACMVRVDQDSRGVVLEVTLEQCNGSERWQHSLVSAIESASPFPAPPDPAVFTRILHLSFQSQPYSPSAPQDGYEPMRVAEQGAGADAAGVQNEAALEALRQELREPASHRSISLTLTGHPADPSPSGGRPAPARSPSDSAVVPIRPPAE